MQEMTRRAALKGTAAVATCAVAGTAVAANSQDAELLALSDQYWALHEDAKQLDHSAPGKPQPEYDAIYDRVSELNDEAFEIATQIVNMPALTPQGLAAKLRIIRLEATFPDHMKQSKQWNKFDATVALGLWTAREDAERLVGEG